MNLNIDNKIFEDVQRSLVAYLPGGILWESGAGLIPGTNLNAIMAGLTGLMLDVDVFNKIYNSEFIPSSAGTDFLENWEQAVGIPDSCFPGPDEPLRSNRRLHVLIKLASSGIQTVADFENLAAILGFPTTEVVPGIGSESDSITNGDFATDTVWTKGTGWTISSGTANKAAGVASDLSQDISSVSGRLYVVKYEISGRTAGTVTPDIGGADGIARSENGSFEELITALAVDTLFRLEADSAFDGSIDNVSVRGSLDLPDAIYTIVVKFPFDLNEFAIDFPIIFGSDEFGILKCLYNQLKPANCQIVTELG